MKNTFSLLLLCLLFNSAFAQKIIEKKLPYSSGQLVNLHLKFADSIRVRYWDRSEVSVRIAVEINGGRLNDALTVQTGSTAEEVSLKTDYDNEMLKEGKAEDCPGQKHYWRTERNGQNIYVCGKITYQVMLPRQAQLKLETINGNIDIQGSTGAPIFAKTISGYVDMSWPGGKGANLAMKTITGEVYSDLDITFTSKKEKNPIVGYQVKGTVNGGGSEVRLESISNDIYVRKTK